MAASRAAVFARVTGVEGLPPRLKFHYDPTQSLQCRVFRVAPEAEQSEYCSSVNRLGLSDEASAPIRTSARLLAPACAAPRTAR
jgi:hypothetical protein